MQTKLQVKIFSDGAVIETMLKDLNSGLVTGFTTNPSLMKKAGITNYLQFAREVLSKISEYPVSFEVFADELDEMYKEAKVLAQLGENVYVKIPVMNSKGETVKIL